MSLVLKVVRPDALQNFVAVNAPGSVRGTGEQSWTAYLQAQGALGKSVQEMEMAFIAAQPGNTFADMWNQKLVATPGNTVSEKLRNNYR